MPHDPPPIAIRPLEPRDAEAARALLIDVFSQSSFLERAREVTGLALAADDGEHRAIAAERAGTLLGLACFGDLAGSDRVMRLHVLASASAHRRDVSLALLSSVDAAARAANARFVFAEVPDEPDFRLMFPLLNEAGYREETRIADYVRDGVALLVFRRVL